MLNNIQIGPFTVHMYGLMIAIGYMAAYLVSCWRAKKKGLDENIIWGILICSVLGILTGSRLLFYLTNIPSILKNPSILWNFKNGYVVYGGILFGVLFGILYCRKKQAPVLKYLDLAMPAVSLAQGFGRIGCFFAGCCYGRETDSWLHIVYTHSDFAPNNVPLVPTQLLSSAGNFLIAAVLFWYSSKSEKDGATGVLYMILYSMGRFLIEIFRDDLRGSFGMLSTSQLISIGVFMLGILFMAVLHKNKTLPKMTDI